MSNSLQLQIDQAAQLLRSSKLAVSFTGAGISTPSGIPDFRSPGSGLWNTYDPFEVASLTAFRRHPQNFFNWIKPLVKTARQAQPNLAHTCLARMEKAGFLRAVITQNIDGLHQKAGSSHVIELHGSAQSATCPLCFRKFGADWLPDSFLLNDRLPRCENCGAVIKPDVVLFEELLPVDAWLEAERLCESADVILVIGSSLEVYPANSLPRTGLQRGARLIIVTRSRTPLDQYADFVFNQDLIEVVPHLCRVLNLL